jgi:hypothetical protein
MLSKQKKLINVSFVIKHFNSNVIKLNTKNHASIDLNQFVKCQKNLINVTFVKKHFNSKVVKFDTKKHAVIDLIEKN